MDVGGLSGGLMYEADNNIDAGPKEVYILYFMQLK